MNTWEHTYDTLHHNGWSIGISPFIATDGTRRYVVDIRQREVWIQEEGDCLDECFKKLLAKVKGKESIRASDIAICDMFQQLNWSKQNHTLEVVQETLTMYREDSRIF